MTNLRHSFHAFILSQQSTTHLHHLMLLEINSCQSVQAGVMEFYTPKFAILHKPGWLASQRRKHYCVTL